MVHGVRYLMCGQGNGVDAPPIFNWHALWTINLHIESEAAMSHLQNIVTREHHQQQITRLVIALSVIFVAMLCIALRMGTSAYLSEKPVVSQVARTLQS